MDILHDKIRNVLLELGEHWDAVDGIQELPEGGWALLLHEDRRIDAGFDAQRGVLVLQTPVGQPHAARALECYEALLSYNTLWERTGGARMALGGTGGEVALLIDVPTHDLGWAALEAVLRNVDEVARAWREFLSLPPDAPGPAPAFGPGQFA